MSWQTQNPEMECRRVLVVCSAETHKLGGCIQSTVMRLIEWSRFNVSLADAALLPAIGTIYIGRLFRKAYSAIARSSRARL